MTQEEFLAAGTAMFHYFTALLAAKRRSPADDLTSALIAARDSGDSLDERELIALLFLLLVAGHETTTNLIATGTLALLSYPAELARLRADWSLLPGAVEELLRYANPLNHTTDRFTTEPVELGGVTIPAGEWVLCVTSSANRDPSRFADPDRLDVGRDAAGHLAFGHGIHYCLGAPLARLEGEVAFRALLTRFPSLSLAVPSSSLRWRPSSLIHGLEIVARAPGLTTSAGALPLSGGLASAAGARCGRPLLAVISARPAPGCHWVSFRANRPRNDTQSRDRHRFLLLSSRGGDGHQWGTCRLRNRHR